MTEQTRQNVGAIVPVLGYDKVIKHLLLADIADFAAFNEVY